jgi:membrane protein implicated in regulation of membrane protease activity
MTKVRSLLRIEFQGKLCNVFLFFITTRCRHKNVIFNCIGELAMGWFKKLFETFFVTSARTQQNYRGEAIVDKVTYKNKHCRVKFKGVYWTAEAVVPFPLHADDLVKVVGRKNVALLIQSFSD